MCGVTGAIIGGSVVAAGASIYAGNKAAKEASRAAGQATDAQLDMYYQTREDFAPQRQLGYDALGTLRRLYGYGDGPAPDSEPMSYEDFVSSKGGIGSFSTDGGFVQSVVGGLVNARRAYDEYLAEQKAAPVASSAGKPDMSVFFESPDYQFNLGEGQKAIDRSAAARGGLLSGRAVKEGQRFASGLASREYSAFVDRLMQQAGLGSTGIGATSAAGTNAANAIAGIAQNAGNARASAYAQGAAGLNNAVQGGVQNMLLQRYLSASSPTGTYGTPGYGIPYGGALA